ncbi:hemicentin-1-like isoform X3 [Melanotaenia boesemani]|uniref:hemicentin-1-like isoform X3 n=1 Tax=Melanotaenia boesemani TaxID=1250792 RepID=UPI001C0574CB|nr:hemicentin-1-like isoform X3 [Melanotaenia boesemani]
MRESFQHQTRMFVFFWITVFVSVRGSSADTGAPVWTYPYCHDKFCITLMDGPIRAEAGLCAVVPCYFTTGDGFTLQHIVWYKCGQNKERCGESDTIFNTNKTNENIKFGFKGRVSLLEPDVSQRNCSIMINDLSKSDSGWYQLRVNGLFYGKTDGWTFIPKTNISVTGLKQKLTVKVPPLTEGQQTTLTCTAPGLCSGSHPKITWMWRGAGEKDVYIPGNITAVHTENLTVVSQRHSSSLTFNLSAEHHNTNVTCKISFTEDTTTEKTVTLQVNHVKEVKINGDRDVEEGKPLNLTCHVESFPPSLVSWTRSGTATYLTKDTLSVQQNKSPTCLEKERICSLFISNLTAEDSGLYICNVKHLNNTMTKEVNITVIYKRKVQISGRTTVKTGDALNLTCSIESFPPSLIMWTKQSSSTNLQSGISLLNDTGSATLVISNVTAEDSGQYVCTAKHLNTTMTELTDVTVTYKRKVQISGRTTVKTGDALNLTCSIESFPPSLIMWTKQNSSTNLQSGISLLNDTGSATFFISNVTAEDSGQYVCTAKHLNTTVTELADVTVTYKRKVQISGRTTVKTGDALNLTCSIESFPPSLIMWTKQSSSTNLQSGISLLNDTGSATLVISNVTAEDSGQYVCTAKHLNTTMTELTDVTVTYKRKVQISGRTIVKKGDALNLTCSIESFPPSLIMWTKRSSSTNLQSGISLLNDTGSATLFMSNVTAEDSGQYVCTAKHLNTTVTELTDVTVTWFSEILNGSGCVHQSAVLTCVCISEGFPLPTIKWPLLQNHREYSVITMVSGYTVNSTVTLTVKHHDNMTIECVSSNDDGEAKRNFSIQQNLSEKEAESRNILEKAPRLEIVIAFLIGVVLTASTCCLTMKCFRKQQKSSGNLDETLEMTTNDPLIYNRQAGEDQTCIHEVLENGAVVAEKSVSEPNSGPREVVYASIDFSLLKTKNPREARKEQDNTKTEYAEIKTDRRENEEENGGKEGEILEDKEEEVMMEEGEEVQHFVTEEEKEAEEAVYSNVKDLMDEI